MVVGLATRVGSWLISLCASDVVGFGMRPSEEYAYNAMRGKGIGTRVTPVRPQPGDTYRPAAFEVSAFNKENYENYEKIPDTIATGRRYYHPTASPISTPRSGPKPNIKATSHADGQPRKELVLNYKFNQDNVPHHYKGEDVFGNFGYIKINGQWADPDSEASLASVFKGIPDPGLGMLPGSKNAGARVMEPQELEEFCSECDGYLSDDEPPMGSFRLTPQQFALLAQGTASEGKGNSWCSYIPPPQEKFTDRPREPRPNKMPWEPQEVVDQETGSLMSGFADRDDIASLLLSSAGVNMEYRPTGYSRMAPQTNLDLLAASTGIPDNNPYKSPEDLANSGPMEAHKLDNTGLMKALGIPDTDEGKLYLANFSKGMEFLNELRVEKTAEAIQADARRYEACMRLSQLIKEAHYLRLYLEDRPCIFHKALAAARGHQPETKPPAPFAMPAHVFAEPAQPTAPEGLKELPDDLGPAEITYLRMLEDAIQGDNRLAKHFEDLTKAWDVHTVEIQAKINKLLAQKNELKELTGLVDWQITLLVPAEAAPVPDGF